jgi:hypothetical protein
MSPNDPLLPALEALDDCEEALRDLDAACCDPGRGPQMQTLGETLGRARDGIRLLGHDAAAARAAAGHLEEARAQVRHLQAGCCEPNRLPMYRIILEGLSAAQREVGRPDGIVP